MVMVIAVSEHDKIILFKSILSEYMSRKSDSLENDRITVLNRISIYDLNSDRYYDLLVQDIRFDTTKNIFREIMSIVRMYL